MDKVLIKLTVPDVPPSINRWTRLHWTRLRQFKKQWELEVWATAVKAKVNNKQLAKAVIRITYFFTDSRRRDKDNYAPKFILDGLVKAGVLQDDNADAIDVDWCFAKGAKRTEIVIWEE
ncbi:hypothetical protein [Sporomusa termitida]|uniref:Uncharacterized protein n=1 Tax=Sporomusa termitida TaxID=2377 RepID=A0A517DS77_9FIRM|nr:hypothetical protein [Sporomusa termitida]QDR80215.1 hypothetical protein SPTER_15340 [Sporomusa termitida]